MNFYLFSKTNWEEMPRLRHQFARMLAIRGHKIFFFQKPTFLIGLQPPIKIEKNIYLVRIPELVHHQLKINRPVKFFSDLYFLFRFKSIIKYIEKPDCVINFNYDFDFLLKTFNSKTIFIINDDFIEMSRFWMRSQAQKMEIATIRNSDKVLTVSEKIIFKYKNIYNSKFTLFLPWAQEKYKQPQKN